MNILLRIALLITLSLTSVEAFAQATGGTDDPLVADTMNSIWIVSGIAAAGAIIGLSTLSFVEEPSEELKNIVTGAAVGVIIGVGVVAYMQATKSKDMYELNGFFNDPTNMNNDFDTHSRVVWHRRNFNSKRIQYPSTFQYTTSF